MIASWIALEDVVPGSDELIYYVGGHRMPEYLYADGTSKNFNVARDGRYSPQYRSWNVPSEFTCPS
jgi:hypothetical protein